MALRPAAVGDQVGGVEGGGSRIAVEVACNLEHQELVGRVWGRQWACSAMPISWTECELVRVRFDVVSIHLC